GDTDSEGWQPARIRRPNSQPRTNERNSQGTSLSRNHCRVCSFYPRKQPALRDDQPVLVAQPPTVAVLGVGRQCQRGPTVQRPTNLAKARENRPTCRGTVRLGMVSIQQSVR